uniref:Uncharacterized protein n=2 Tax=Mycolicibacterium TaxID=1866885 RepID=A0A343VRP2_9MYCO|nr:hypothetical protein B5P44_p00271 [Mycolicibacterium sp. CBMA 213]
MTLTIAPVNSYGLLRAVARTRTAPMNWTIYLTYVAAGLAAADTDVLRDTLGAAEITYDQNSSQLQVTLEVEADTLEQAATTALRTAAAATGLLKPTRLYVLSTTDAQAAIAHPGPVDLDLIGVTEIAVELGVSRQRAGELQYDPDFPRPVVEKPLRLYTRASVRVFKEHWFKTRNPRGGPRRRTPRQD